MLLELHVWGPSFGLPSIDAQCLATIAYMRQVIPRGQWSLVASSDPTLSPTNALPALRNRENGHWVAGYRNILNFIAQYSSGQWDLDASLHGQEGADCTAYSALIQVHGQPLLDLSLYVSSQNYSGITRPIFNTIQPFPLPYLTPPHLRAEAKKRTEYLGLSSLDVDTGDGDKSREPSIIPESLRRGQHTVSSLLAASPETNAQIRLDALATAFFEPIQELKGKKKYLVTNSYMSSVDCLALGFMSLMLYPNLPQPWLARTMRKKFPDLVKWVEELKNEVFGGVVNVHDAMLTKSGHANAVQQKEMNLPWQVPEPRGLRHVGGVFLASLADSIPIVGQHRKDDRLRRSGGGETVRDTSPVWRYVATVGSLVAAVGLGAGFALHQGLIQLPENRPGKKDDESEKTQDLGDIGDAVQALFAFADQMDPSVQRQRESETRNGPTVEVDVDLGQDGIARDRLG
ncbi:hypothetical protein DSL72_006341 [Monilinia vaccinii-corymbosi]|uniref:Mitochondrial outer membrane transport complex Sam37/metaxin N-terminal domain-containing protein n=1 Tax=Monilinia vaccinii-corymbosi TaxID=61207 RepID=A0A8A3PLZ2_9HELO|nr:hypothetical protein DSL72_006341 [Monilinia vaccinii-corymbosi]